MFRISCFADEISADLREQIEVMERNKIKYVELRSVWDKNVLDLSDGELDEVKNRLLEAGIAVSSIGSPIGKAYIEDDFGKHLDRFKRAIDTALRMESRYIRVFSFYIREDKYAMYEDTVIDRLKQMLRIATDNDIILLHENEADIFGESSTRCLQLFESINSSSFRAVFDPSNFVVAGEDVLNESFMKLKGHIEYIHVKDSVKGTGEIVVAGKGDGRLREILDALRDREDMFVSLEPHLSLAGKFMGFTGPELFEKDLEALKGLLNSLNIDFM
jgi:3-dehydroshikimate dehydratase